MSIGPLSSALPLPTGVGSASLDEDPPRRFSKDPDLENSVLGRLGLALKFACVCALINCLRPGICLWLAKGVVREGIPVNFSFLFEFFFGLLESFSGLLTSFLFDPFFFDVFLGLLSSFIFDSLGCGGLLISIFWLLFSLFDDFFAALLFSLLDIFFSELLFSWVDVFFAGLFFSLFDNLFAVFDLLTSFVLASFFVFDLLACFVFDSFLFGLVDPLETDSFLDFFDLLGLRFFDLPSSFVFDSFLLGFALLLFF